MNRILLVDGNAIAYRLYFASTKKNEGICTSTGIPVNICRNFLPWLNKVIRDEQATHIAVAFDSDRSFRHQIDSRYKANRPPKPKDATLDLRNLKLLLPELNICCYEVDGYEADDVIGTLARLAVDRDLEVKIVSSDRDLFQLVDDSHCISMLYQSGVRSFQVDEDFVWREFGVGANQIVDYKALVGDKSDNYKGVPGIGAIAASNLFKEYDSCREMYDNLDEISAKFRIKLESGIDDCRRCYQLAKISQHAPLIFNPDNALTSQVNVPTDNWYVKELELNYNFWVR